MKHKDLLSRSIVLIHKQAGRTSHDEVAIIKSALRKLGIKAKVGHSGTLDPKVTGLLVVGIGAGTRVLEYMLHSEKRYVGQIIFHAPVTRGQLDAAVEQFTGKIEQLPPIKSAVKREVRTREVYGMNVVSFDEKKRVAIMECAVERGTYIRKLFHDMGEVLGISAHMGDLHRTHVGPFSESDGVVTAEDFKRAIITSNSWNPIMRFLGHRTVSRHLMPVRDAVKDLQYVVLHPGVDSYISSGAPVFLPGVASLSDDFFVSEETCVFSHEGVLVAIGEAKISKEDFGVQEKGTAVLLRKVLI